MTFNPSTVLLDEDTEGRNSYKDHLGHKSINITHDVNNLTRSDDGILIGEEQLVISPRRSKDSLEITVAKESVKLYQVGLSIETPSLSRKRYFERLTSTEAEEMRKKSFYRSRRYYMIHFQNSCLQNDMLNQSDAAYNAFKKSLTQ